MKLFRIKLPITCITVIIFLLSVQYSRCEESHQIQTASDGSVYIFGVFSGELRFNNGDTIGNIYSENEGYFLAKIDNQGHTLWVNHLETWGEDCGGNCPGIGLCTDINGNVIVTASFIDTIKLDNSNYLSSNEGRTAFIAKYDSAGNYIWSRRSYGSLASKGVDVESDSAGYIYLTGSFVGGTFTIGTLPPISYSSYLYDIFLVKLDSSGNGLWIRQLHGEGPNQGSHHDVFSISVDQLGNSYVIGYFGIDNHMTPLHFGNLTIYSTDEDLLEIFLAKCSPEGEPEWLNKVTNISGDDFPEQIAVDDSNNLHFTGGFVFESQFDTLPIVNADVRDVFITQYDTSGSARWVRQGAAEYSDYHNYSSGLALDDFDNISLVGWYSDTIAFPPLAPIFTNYGNYFLARFDNDGDAQCINSYPELIEDISCDSDGNTYGIVGSYEWWDNSITISKWDDNCNHLWNIEIERELIVSIGEQGDEHFGITIYPNPFTTSTTIEYELTEPAHIQLTIYNHLGEAVEEAVSAYLPPGVHTYEWSAEGLSEGMYFAVLSTDEGVSVVKLIKQ